MLSQYLVTRYMQQQPENHIGHQSQCRPECLLDLLMLLLRQSVWVWGGREGGEEGERDKGIVPAEAKAKRQVQPNEKGQAPPLENRFEAGRVDHAHEEERGEEDVDRELRKALPRRLGQDPDAFPGAEPAGSSDKAYLTSNVSSL